MALNQERSIVLIQQHIGFVGANEFSLTSFNFYAEY